MSISEIKELWYFANDELNVDADKNAIRDLSERYGLQRRLLLGS